MERVSISELKNHLSTYLQRVRAGERVEILDAGRPIARIVPLAQAEDRPRASDDALLDELERKGILRRGSGDVLSCLPKHPRKGTGVLAALLDERRTRR